MTDSQQDFSVVDGFTPGLSILADILPGPELSEPAIVTPVTPSKKFQDEAFAYVSKWCRASREFIGRKVEQWKLLEDLYHNRRELNSWAARSNLTVSENRAGFKRRQTSDKNRWQADIILSPSYIVDNWADKAYQSFFSGP